MLSKLNKCLLLILLSGQIFYCKFWWALTCFGGVNQGSLSAISAYVPGRLGISALKSRFTFKFYSFLFSKR